MKIANPIYDAVFKFLMEDKKAAALIIGAITGFDIEDIELRPTEVTAAANAGIRQWTVYRLDLAAKVKTAEGTQLVLIEIQKAKFHTDIERFRRYLGAQYSSPANYEQVDGHGGIERKRALPIFTIDILGECLDHNGDVPVIRVSRGYVDTASGEKLSERDEFIESLTHDSAIIQISALRARRRNRLEQILAVFDQALIKPDDRHLLNLKEEDYPQECQALIRRLLRALADNEVRQHMIVEDDIVSEFEIRERQAELLRKVADEAVARETEERRQKEEERRLKEEERRLKEAALAELEELKRQLGQK